MLRFPSLVLYLFVLVFDSSARNPVRKTSPTGHAGTTTTYQQIGHRNQYRNPSEVPSEPNRQNDFRCRNGAYISRDLVCNGEYDCRDRSDEGSFCNGVCKVNAVPCGNGRCADQRYDCTGFDFCGDGSRNENCSVCQRGAYKCPSGRCVRREAWHPLASDLCDDGSNITSTGECNMLEIKCPNGKCTQASNICDGKNDCGDNSDEFDCRGVCRAGSTPCSDGRCVKVDVNLDCTGFDVCGDGSRNKGCTGCKYGAILCPDIRCVRPERQCDGNH